MWWFNASPMHDCAGNSIPFYVKIHDFYVWWHAFAPAKKLRFQSNQSLLFIFCFSFSAALAFRFLLSPSVAAPGATTTVTRTATEWFFDDFELNFLSAAERAGKPERASDIRSTTIEYINSYFSHVSKGIENFFNLMHDAHRHHTIRIFLKSLCDFRFSLRRVPAALALASPRDVGVNIEILLLWRVLMIPFILNQRWIYLCVIWWLRPTNKSIAIFLFGGNLRVCTEFDFISIKRKHLADRFTITTKANWPLCLLERTVARTLPHTHTHTHKPPTK